MDQLFTFVEELTTKKDYKLSQKDIDSIVKKRKQLKIPKPFVNNPIIIETLHLLINNEHFKNSPNKNFRIKAYNNTIDSIKSLRYSLQNLKDAKALNGAGAKISSKIAIIIEIGTLPKVNKFPLKQKAFSDFMKIYGVGAVRAMSLIEKDDVFSIQQLQIGINDNRIRLNEKQLIGLKHYTHLNQRIPYNEITVIKNKIQNLCTNIEFEIAGSYRRKLLTSGDIDIIIKAKEANTTDIKDMVFILKKNKLITDTLAHGSHKFMGVILHNNIHRRIDIICRNPLTYYPALLYFTGSKEFNINMRNIALRLNYTLNEDGLYKLVNGRSSDKPLLFKSEEEIFDKLNMDYTLPENR